MAVAEKNEIWGALALRGVVTLLFGIAAVFWPGITLVTLLYLFAGFILVNGIITFVLGLTNSYNEGTTFFSRMLSILLGVLEIGVGVYLLRHVGIAFATFILLIGLVLIVRGVFEFFAALFEEGTAMSKTATLIMGLITALAGVVILFQPASGGVAFVWILGIYALIAGPLMIALAMDMKKATELKI
jgi:uncharacterized membrane protein HdeD (DUF308 family)